MNDTPGRARPVAVARASVGQAEANKAVAASDAAGFRAAQNPELAADQVSWDWETQVENAPRMSVGWRPSKAKGLGWKETAVFALPSAEPSARAARISFL